MSVAELEKLAPGFAWKGFLASANLGKLDRVIVAEKSAFPKLAAIYAATPIETIQAWQAFHIADNAAPYLSKPFTDAYFDMHDKTLSGQKVQKVRWKRGVFAVAGGDFGVGDRFGTYRHDGLGRRPALQREIFPARSQGQDRGAGRQPESRLSRAARRSSTG